jgi:hypothetical protein
MNNTKQMPIILKLLVVLPAVKSSYARRIKAEENNHVYTQQEINLYAKNYGA